MSALDGLFGALREFILPEAAPAEAHDRATEALLGLDPAYPKGVAELRQGTEAVMAMAPGATVIAGNPSAFTAGGELVMVKAWTSPRGGFISGNALYAEVGPKGTWGYLTCRPERQGSSQSASAVLNLSADTLEAEGNRLYPTSEIKFKFRSGGLGYVQALMAIQAWMAMGDGTRKNLILVCQLSGKAYPERNKEGVETGRTVQPVGGFYLLQVPPVNATASGSIDDLPLESSPTTLAAANAAAAGHKPKATVASTADALAGIAADVDSL
jgi:hypothetical protein